MTDIPRVFSGLLRYDSLAFLNPAYPIVTVPASRASPRGPMPWDFARGSGDVPLPPAAGRSGT